MNKLVGVFVSTSRTQFFTSFHVLQTNADEDDVTILGKWPHLFTSRGEKSSCEVEFLHKYHQWYCILNQSQFCITEHRIKCLLNVQSELMF